MTIRRGFLYAGVFLLAAGGVVLLAQAGMIDTEAVIRTLAFWPLAVIAVGVGLIVRHTRIGLPGGMMAAAVPGLMFGGMIVAIPDLPDMAAWSAPCGDANAADAVTQRQGAFGAAGSIDLLLACGELVVTTGPGNSWQLETTAGRGNGAIVSDAPDHLSIRSADRQRSFAAPARGDAWRLRLPTGPTLDMAAEVSAGKATLDLSGARLGTLRLDVNAGDASLDLDGASVSRLAVTINAAKATVQLPATSDLTADLRVNAGSLRVCAPADLGLRIRGDASLAATTYNGLVHSGDTWESPSYATTTFHADVTVSVNLGSVVVNPQGGCL
jgi:hypothetical protein